MKRLRRSFLFTTSTWLPSVPWLLVVNSAFVAGLDIVLWRYAAFERVAWPLYVTIPLTVIWLVILVGVLLWYPRDRWR